MDEYDFRHFGGVGGQYVLQRDRSIIESMLDGERGVLLDVPCGTGIYSALFNAHGWQVVAADASPAMLLKTTTRDERLLLTRCDINALPFESSSFDAILTIRLFQHLPKAETARVLHELRRVLGPHGRLIFDTFRWTPRSFLRRKGEMYVFSHVEVQQMVEQAGLHVTQIRTAYLFSPLAYRKLPMHILHSLDLIERIVPARWLLRTFWACTKK